MLDEKVTEILDKLENHRLKQIDENRFVSKHFDFLEEKIQILEKKEKFSKSIKKKKLWIWIKIDNEGNNYHETSIAYTSKEEALDDEVLNDDKQECPNRKYCVLKEISIEGLL